MIFRKIVLVVQRIYLLVKSPEVPVLLPVCFCFSLGTMFTNPREHLCHIQLNSTQQTCPGNGFLKASVFGVLKYASDFLSVIYIPELLFPGHSFNYLMVDAVIDLFATRNII